MANNNNLFALYLRNIVLSKPVVITGVSGTTGFVDVVLNNVSFNETASMDISCINNITFKQCYSECDIRFENINYCDIEASQFQGKNLTIVADGTADVPGNGGNFTLVANALTLLGTPTYFTIEWINHHTRIDWVSLGVGMHQLLFLLELLFTPILLS